MTSEFVQFTENTAANRAALAEGVKGTRCIDARPVTETEAREFLAVVSAPSAFISSAEFYEGGAVNAYVRASEGQAVGFVRVRV